jgi:hypothetical protein
MINNKPVIGRVSKPVRCYARSHLRPLVLCSGRYAFGGGSANINSSEARRLNRVEKNRCFGIQLGWADDVKRGRTTHTVPESASAIPTKPVI